MGGCEIIVDRDRHDMAVPAASVGISCEENSEVRFCSIERYSAGSVNRIDAA